MKNSGTAVIGGDDEGSGVSLPLVDEVRRHSHYGGVGWQGEGKIGGHPPARPRWGGRVGIGEGFPVVKSERNLTGGVSGRESSASLSSSSL